MAFRQQQQPQRHQVANSSQQQLQVALPPRQRSPSPERTEWVLFSPDSPTDTYAHTDSGATQTDLITGRLSDFGSLETAAASGTRHDQSAQDAETEDLDSLDDGLREFSEPHSSRDQQGPLDQSRDTVLPAHDGLGMFPGDSTPVQEQLWQHERFNPRRRRSLGRRSSLQRKFDALTEENAAATPDDEKTQRIERWRTEQSKAILEEIEKETRRRNRRTRVGSSKSSQDASAAMLSQSAPEKETAPPPPSRTARLSFWERITRRVIRDLIGIDDATLEFIFGESLPEEPVKQDASAASAIVDYAEQALPNDNQLTASASGWEERLLARISKELGILLNHISEHPGAFSTYLRTQEIPPYAGLPNPTPVVKEHIRPRRAAPRDMIPTSSTDEPNFIPTLGHHHHHHRRHSAITTDPSLWGIEEEDESHLPPQPSASEEAARLQREKEYWERDLDVKMVFGFLRNRLSSSSPSPPPSPATAAAAAQPSSSSTAFHPHISSSTTHNQGDSLRRAALIRHHHPLVSRNVPTGVVPPKPQLQRRESRLSAHSATPLSPILGRRSSRGADETESCASQSTKRSRTGRSGSSRNYWDLGGHSDVGGGSGTWSVGWGEV